MQFIPFSCNDFFFSLRCSIDKSITFSFLPIFFNLKFSRDLVTFITSSFKCWIQTEYLEQLHFNWLVNNIIRSLDFVYAMHIYCPWYCHMVIQDKFSTESCEFQTENRFIFEKIFNNDHSVRSSNFQFRLHDRSEFSSWLQFGSSYRSLIFIQNLKFHDTI